MGQRVLIIDDEWAIQLALRARLEAHGFSVEAACDGPSGLSAMRADPPDVVLLDLRMPEMDGMEVLRRLRADQRTAMTPVIILTANVQDTVKQQAINAGATEFLTKPYESGVVLNAIRTALSPSGAGAEEINTNQQGRTER